MANKKSEKINKMTTFVASAWIDEYNKFYFSVDLDLKKIKEESEKYQKLFSDYPDITNIETIGDCPKEISSETYYEIDEENSSNGRCLLLEYKGPELEDHNEWRPRYATIEYRENGAWYRVGPRDLDTTSTFFIPLKSMEGRATDRQTDRQTDRDLLLHLQGICVINQICDWAFTELSPNEEFAEIQKMIESHFAQ